GVVLQEGFTLRDLYEERAPLYEQHADYILSLDGESVEESADRLAELLGDTIREEDYAGIL
ncbi:MAG: shikimate kinase, partial [Clostridia bacterium]|nr:shikimate kinase [Clostridia bacterium]